MNISKELKKIERFDLVSFDVFDTLIVRSVPLPKDIFLLAGQSVLGSLGESTQFQSARILAECEARNKSQTGEVSIDEIYSSLEGYPIDVRDNLKEAELRAEMESCRPREEVVALFNSVKDKGKDIVLISDMYLSSSFIGRMLSKCGIDGMKGVFVSNELGCDKRSGRLFSEVRKKMSNFKGKQLHYGDSFKADYLGALKAGIKPRFVFKRNFLRMLWKKII